MLKNIKEPEIWMSATYADMTTLGDAASQWDFVKANVDAVLLHINRVGHPAHKYTDERLKALVDALKQNDIQFAVESIGTEYYEPGESSGEKSAQDQLEKLSVLYKVGGTCHHMTLDGSVNKLMFPEGTAKGIDSVEECVDQMIEFMRIVRKSHPETRIYELTNFPNWGWKGEPAYRTPTGNKMGYGDYFPVLQAIIKKSREAGMPIDGVTVDNPYGYATGVISVEAEAKVMEDTSVIDWMSRVRELEDYVKSEGLEFNLIINDQAGGYTSNEAFYHETIKFYDAYTAAGGSPTRYIIESWYKYPDIVVPEDSGYSLTALTKAIIERVRNYKV